MAATACATLIARSFVGGHLTRSAEISAVGLLAVFARIMQRIPDLCIDMNLIRSFIICHEA